jgi:tRNA(Ile)-lysidine synthase
MAGRLDPAVAEVRRSVRWALRDLSPGSSVLVACSGGADSLALAAATAFEGNQAGWSVGAVVVDHGLQPGSAEVAAGVAAQLGDLGCYPVDQIAVHVAPGAGPEAAARDARYAALSTAAEPQNSVVLLGHTRDDQAETVLLGLVRGSGVRSLAGMPAVTGRFRRPLLDVPREQTQQACRALGLHVWQDPQNADPRFTRVRVRHAVLPVLEREIGPGIAEALARTAEQARDDADALDVLAAELLRVAQRSDRCCTVEPLAAALPALRRRVLRHLAVSAGCPSGALFAVHVKAMEQLVTDWHGQRGVDLPGGVTARRGGGLLSFERAAKAP